MFRLRKQIKGLNRNNLIASNLHSQSPWRHGTIRWGLYSYSCSKNSVEHPLVSRRIQDDHRFLSWKRLDLLMFVSLHLQSRRTRNSKAIEEATANHA
jgi:hypothetical protein